MAEKSLWFDDDLEHSAQDWADFFGGAFSTGVNVYDNPNSLRVQADTAMNVKVNSGKAYINGRYYDSGGDLSFVLTSAAGSIKYVRIVVRVDLSAKTIISAAKESLSAHSDLTRDNTVYEISLAKITIPAGATSITSAMIVDERSNSTVCGFFRFAGHEAERVPAGVVDYFAGQIAPTGWLECNGAIVSRSGYPDLFLAIGTVFGEGDGATTFKLPDLRGEFIRGWDNDRGIDVERSFGSFQNGTAFSVLGRWADSGGNEYMLFSGDAEKESNVYRNRPRNIALLPIIKI